MKRVVITGMGMVTPLGNGVDHNWQSILAGKSGLGKIEGFDVSDISCQIAGQVPMGDEDGALNMDAHIEPKDQRKLDKFIQFGLVAAQEAIADSGWVATSDEQKERTGVMIGSGIGGLSTIVETSNLMNEKGPRRISPFFIPSALINLISGHVSIQHGFKGPNHAVVTACSTGAHAIGDASRLIMFGDADVMVAGGQRRRFAVLVLLALLQPAHFHQVIMMIRKRHLAHGIRDVMVLSWVKAQVFLF